MVWKLSGNGTVEVRSLDDGSPVDQPDIAAKAKAAFDGAVEQASKPHLSVVRNEEDED